MKTWLTIAAVLLVTASAMAQGEKVLFSSPGGFYEDSFELSLDCFYANHHIRYTTNGGTPNATSPLYDGPLTLDGTLYSTSDIYTIVNCIPSVYHAVDSVRHAIVIRAAVFDNNDSCVSAVATNSYFIQSLGCVTHGLPVVSIAADSLALFDYETGIFVPGIHYDPGDSTHTGNFQMTGREWERPINFEFYETDNRGINQPCGLRTHGGASRWYQQKGMRLHAREEYGHKRFKHQFFDSTPINSFKRLNLHPFRCSNWLQTGGQEHLAQTVAAQLDIDALAVRQTVVFINGEYWGIYTLEESPDERYLEDHYDIDLDHVSILKYWGVPQYGDPTDWRTFYNWLNDADLSQPEDSAYAYQRIDVHSFVDYMLFETYSANLDWPQNNVLHWNAEPGMPFRWIYFDGDGCFTRPRYESINNAMNQGGNSAVFNHFLENQGFKDLFYQRYVELLGTLFRPKQLQSVMDGYAALVEGEIDNQSERFGFPVNKARWETDLGKANEFFLTRNDFFKEEILAYISINEPNIATFTCFPNPSSGTFHIRVHSDADSILPIELFDVIGRRVLYKEIYLRKGTNNATIETNFSNGLYIIRMGHLTSKLFIK